MSTPDGTLITVSPPDQFVDNARKFLGAKYRHDERCRLAYHHGSYFEWTGTHWRPLGADYLQSMVSAVFSAAMYKIQVTQGRGVNQVTVDELRPFPVNNKTLDNLMRAIRNLVILPEDVTNNSWLVGDGPDPKDFIVVKNGLLHAPTRELLPHTPRFFNKHTAPYEYDINAAKPERWLQFLDEVFPDDVESIECLQEMFGYLLSNDTRAHRIFMLSGPTRSGKGTIDRLLKQLLGPKNVGTTSLASLNEHFGLESIVDKSLVTMGDVRFSGRNADLAIERLLGISGEDEQPVHAKRLRSYDAVLPCRLLMLMNELPVLKDKSTALRARMLLFKTGQSFADREDFELGDKLRAELPGILLWALDGLDRLRERGYRFVQPAAGQDDLQRMVRLSSPISAFVEDCCTFGEDYRQAKDDLFTAWKSWCMDQERHPGTKDAFFKDLYDTYPQLKNGKTLAAAGVRRNAVVGLTATPETSVAVGVEAWLKQHGS